MTEVLSENVWSKIGADLGAYMSVDSIGTPFSSGGLSARLYDMARFGQMILGGGKVGDEQVVPASVVEKIGAGGDRRAFADAGTLS